MEIGRTAAALVEERLRTYPAVALVGPRQCGKTTLAKRLGGQAFDVEQLAERVRVDLEWGAIAESRELTVLDEAQAWPELFPRLRAAIDADRRRNGRFLLLGSVSPALMLEVAESLAGRLALVELTPFLLAELTGAQRRRHWLTGGFPDGGVLRPSAFPGWQRDYLTLLAQRDLPTWGLPARPQTIERFLHMLAALHGQTWNASQLGQSLGLSYHTVNRYLDFLEGAFLVRRLEPFSANLGKRLVKSPKVYWRDSGLLHALLGVGDREGLLRQPWVGASWEGYAIEQVLSHLAAAGRRHAAFWFRTSDRHEIDLVLELDGERWAIEIKLTTAPDPSDLRKLEAAADLISADRRFLLSQTPRAAGDERVGSTNLEGLIDVLGSGTTGRRPSPRARPRSRRGRA